MGVSWKNTKAKTLTRRFGASQEQQDPDTLEAFSLSKFCVGVWCHSFSISVLFHF